MLAQLVRSLTASWKVSGSIPGLAMGLNIWVIFFRHTVLGQGRKAVGPPGGWRATLEMPPG